MTHSLVSLVFWIVVMIILFLIIIRISGRYYYQRVEVEDMYLATRHVPVQYLLNIVTVYSVSIRIKAIMSAKGTTNEVNYAYAV